MTDNYLLTYYLPLLMNALGRYGQTLQRTAVGYSNGKDGHLKHLIQGQDFGRPDKIDAHTVSINTSVMLI